MADLTPVAPGVGDEADTSVQPSAAELAEDAEWDAALEEYAPGVSKIKPQEDEDEQADTKAPAKTDTKTEEEDDAAEKPAPVIDPNETADEKTAREERERLAAEKGDDDSESEEGPDQSVRTARQIQRESARQVEEMAADVREKMFADQPRELVDGDGDPIKSIQDVMKLVNPITQEAFTEDEAATWLLAAQQKLNQNLAQMDRQIDQIANVNVDLKDQSDSVNYQYGELLRSMPELRDQLWTEYQKTLVTDPVSGIVTGMPVSLESFYDIALTPYVKLAESLEAQAEAEKVREAEVAKATKRANRTDRSDIFGRGDVQELSEEDKEWADAAKEYYGNQR